MNTLATLPQIVKLRDGSVGRLIKADDTKQTPFTVRLAAGEGYRDIETDEVHAPDRALAVQYLRNWEGLEMDLEEKERKTPVLGTSGLEISQVREALAACRAEQDASLDAFNSDLAAGHYA